ncbi:uncharacterized protein BCR38DRAFT_436244 [Pseudomassariella vexata]|uniref:Uncharacterized protein n=1 Tax=Pseudomassariella vexata TaxID=1141098 RepID=A0A1Y2DVE3_9PEZI|nr:uncharacterized protein BCR38DRAFT_436244 [Pseudomassariella vexata]ORY63223.1 hypothetical protein BCR38DRAFT_436244 [Pseudomassariella vexata]
MNSLSAASLARTMVFFVDFSYLQSVNERLQDCKASAEDRRARNLPHAPNIDSRKAAECRDIFHFMGDNGFQQQANASLSFSDRQARHEGIADAHQQTPWWALSGQGNGESNSNRLLSWLRLAAGPQ